MFKLIIQNHLGEQLQLTQNENYALIDVDGLTPPQANINVGENANFDGATFNSAKLNTREIVLTIRPLNDVEENRINLYRYIKAKKPCVLYIQNGSRSVYIEGYIKSCDADLFSKKEQMQVVVFCPDPYFKDSAQGEIYFSTIHPYFIFPMDIEEEGIEFSVYESEAEVVVQNVGDSETGMIIEFYALNGSAENPVIYNATTGQQMQIEYSMQEGDILRINTVKGNKGVYLIRNGETTNILNYLDLTVSEWLVLESSANTLIFGADSGQDNLICTVWYNILYEGV